MFSILIHDLPEAPKTRKYNFELKSIKISKETIKGFDPKSGKYCSQGSSDELKPINATLFRNANRSSYLSNAQSESSER